MAEPTSHISLETSLSSFAALTDVGNEVDSVAVDTSASRQCWLTRRGAFRKRTSLFQINVYRNNHTSLEGALLSIIEEKDRVSYPEERIIVHVTKYILEGARIECTDVHGNTPLHKAAWMGFPDLTKELLQRGADVHALNCDGQIPMEIALCKGLELNDDRTEDYSRVAALVIKEMEPAKVREFFLCSQTEACKFKFRDLLCKPDMQEATDAVLDTLIERIPQSKKAIKVHYSLLEANDNGEIQAGHFHRRSNFKYIVDKDNKATLIHPAVMLLIRSKWRRFARNKLIINFIYWAVTMTVLSIALYLGAKSNHSISYSTTEDYFRAICEGLMLLLITIAVIRDILVISVVRQKFFTEFKFFIFTYFNILTAVLLYVYIILHVINVPQRWFIASIAFVVYTLRGFRFLLTIRSISNYVLVLIRIIIHDIFTFLVVFAVVLFATSGGIYLEEQLFTSGMNVTMGMQNSTLNMPLPDLVLIGIRMMVEGERITEYTNFGWLGYGTYLVFMFFVVVVLQSLLIAQMSDTFTNAQIDAKHALILNRARSIVNVEETTNTLKLSWISKVLKLAKIKLTLVKEEVWDDPGKYLKENELPESVVYRKKLMNLERMMTTQRELVEELRDTMIEDQKKLMTSLKSNFGDPK